MPHKSLKEQKKYRKDYALKNKKKISEYRKQWRKSPSGRASLRNTQFKIYYGITLAEYEQMYEEAKGCCKICGRYEAVLHVDHNHETGQVRGLLCNNCNVALGLVQDDTERLVNMIDYLGVYNARPE